MTTTRRPAPPADAASIATAVERLGATEHGREVAHFLRANQMQVRVVPDPVFQAVHGGSGGVYDPRTRAISIPQSAIGSKHLVTTLAHEGTHALDYSSRPSLMMHSLGIMAGTSSDASRALVTLDNPITAWLDSLTARRNEDEVRAYHVQAQVAHELGLNEGRWAHGQASDGTPKRLDEVRDAIATDDMYRMSPTNRLLLGGGLSLGVTGAAAIGAQMGVQRLLPNSFVAVNPWTLYAAAGALTGAFVLGDQLRARRLDDG